MRQRVGYMADLHVMKQQRRILVTHGLINQSREQARDELPHLAPKGCCSFQHHLAGLERSRGGLYVNLYTKDTCSGCHLVPLLSMYVRHG